MCIRDRASEMRGHLDTLISQRQNELERYRLVLQENNPKKILANGYAVVSAENGHVISLSLIHICIRMDADYFRYL